MQISAVWLCFDLILLKSVHKKNVTCCHINTRPPTPWTSLDGWILSCQKGAALHDNSDPEPNSTNLEEPCYSSLSGRVFSFAEHGDRHIPSLRQLYEQLFLTNGLPCMILAEASRPNRPKNDESVLHMMSLSCILLRAFDLFEPPGWPFLLHRVGHWWCTYLLLMQLFSWEFLLGRGPGLTLECTWSFALR